MPNIAPYQRFNTSFIDVQFSPDGQYLWLLSEQQLNAYHIEDQTTQTLWQTTEASFFKMCIAQAFDAIFLVGRHNETDIVLVALDLNSGQERRRFRYNMGQLLAEERFNIFKGADYFWCSNIKTFQYDENRHLVAQCSDECGDFILHWSSDLEIDPVLIEYSSDGWEALTQCINTSQIIVGGFLYDLEDRCLTMLRKQKYAALCHNEITQQTLRYFTDGCIISLSWAGEDDIVELERIGEEDGWNFPLESTIAISHDAQWLIALDAWYDDILEGRDDYAAHIGIWHTQTGQMHAECLTQTFTEFGGMLQLDPNQRLICVSYDDTIELFSLDLPPQPSAQTSPWRFNTQPLEQYVHTLPNEQFNGTWDQCPLPRDTIAALDQRGVLYAGTDQPKRVHNLPKGISWVDAETGISWSDHDPKDQFNVIAPMVWSIIEHLQWPTRQWSIWDRSLQESINLEIIDGASEQLDCIVDGRRRLIHFIAYTETQYYYGVDLLERSDEVPVYCADHDFSDGATMDFYHFEQFVHHLKPPKP